MKTVRATVSGWLWSAVVITAGCTQAPLTRPTVAAPMNQPVALGSTPTEGELASARQQLQGTWDLVALQLRQDSGAFVPIRATGILTYDAFGNLTIEARTTDPAAPVAAREVDKVAFKGRAVLDLVRGELKLMDFSGNADPNEVLAIERRRQFKIDGDALTLSSLDEQNQVTAVATWHRQ